MGCHSRRAGGSSLSEFFPHGHKEWGNITSGKLGARTTSLWPAPNLPAEAVGRVEGGGKLPPLVVTHGNLNKQSN